MALSLGAGGGGRGEASASAGGMASPCILPPHLVTPLHMGQGRQGHELGREDSSETCVTGMC